MRVVEVISDSNIGGAGVLLLNRLRHTDTSKYDVRVLLPRGSKLCERIATLKIKYTELNVRADRSFSFLAVFEYVRALRRIAPDVVNCHGALSARIAARLCGVPVKLCTRHCVYPVTKAERFARKFVGGINDALSDEFIAVAHSARNNLIELGVRPSKIRVIINGAEPLERLTPREKVKVREELGISENAFVLSLCARLERCKGHEWFLNVLKELSTEKREYVALFIGDGSQRGAIESTARELGVLGCIRFVGFVQNVSRYMNIADVNINCSIGTETSSLALSEGMSIGLPAVVSDYGGNGYMIRHGENGFICHCYDFKKMAKYIKRLSDDREVYERMSTCAARRYKEELNAKRMSEQTYLLYDKWYNAFKE